MRRSRRIVGTLVLIAVMLVVDRSPAEAGRRDSPTSPRVTRASVSSAGAEGDRDSAGDSVSGDGRYVTFHSEATNLVPGDTNGALDVFVHDRRTGRTTRVSVSSAGAQGNARSAAPSVSRDGRYVTFWSEADNLVPGDTNGARDVFVYDRRTARTSRISLSSTGAQGDGPSDISDLSADGQVIGFRSAATNLVAGDTNGLRDAFVHDRRTGETTRVNVSTGGLQANGGSFFTKPSGNGRYVAFESSASNLVPGDTNDAPDVFVRDRQTGRTSRASVATSGAQASGTSGGPTVSDDGRYVCFFSDADDVVPGETGNDDDVFVRDRLAGTTQLVSSNGGRGGNNRSNWPDMSPDGRFVVYSSEADNLVPDDTNGFRDMFLFDRRTGTTQRVSVSPGGQQGNDDVWAGGGLTPDGRAVVYITNASNIVPDDTNNVADVMVYEPARPHHGPRR